MFFAPPPSITATPSAVRTRPRRAASASSARRSLHPFDEDDGARGERGPLSAAWRRTSSGLASARTRTTASGSKLIQLQTARSTISCVTSTWPGAAFSQHRREVDGPPEVVATLEADGAGVEADVRGRQSRRQAPSTISSVATTPAVGSRKWNITPSPSHFTGLPSWRSAGRWTSAEPSRQVGRGLVPPLLGDPREPGDVEEADRRRLDQPAARSRRSSASSIFSDAEVLRPRVLLMRVMKRQDRLLEERCKLDAKPECRFVHLHFGHAGGEPREHDVRVPPVRFDLGGTCGGRRRRRGAADRARTWGTRSRRASGSAGRRGDSSSRVQPSGLRAGRSRSPRGGP